MNDETIKDKIRKKHPDKLLLGPPNWRQVALSIGERMGDVWPDHYYSFSPQQWFDFMMVKLIEIQEKQK